jgi:hypothetical protein
MTPFPSGVGAPASPNRQDHGTAGFVGISDLRHGRVSETDAAAQDLDNHSGVLRSRLNALLVEVTLSE